MKNIASRKKKKKVKDILLTVIIVLLLLISAFCGYKIWTDFHTQDEAEKEVEKLNLLVKDSLGSVDLGKKFSKSAYNRLKQENEDFQCYLDFDNGLISIPVVQSYDNDHYLHRSFYGEWAELGTPFLNATSKFDDQNIVIYGHNSAISDTVMFSPLRQMLKEEVFKDNHRFSLYFENEVREYEVVAIYWYNLEEDAEYDFTVPNWMNLDEFNNYFSYVERKNEVNSTVDYSFADNFVTFQTCRSRQPNYRMIVVSVEVNRKSYN